MQKYQKRQQKNNIDAQEEHIVVARARQHEGEEEFGITTAGEERKETNKQGKQQERREKRETRNQGGDGNMGSNLG